MKKILLYFILLVFCNVCLLSQTTVSVNAGLVIKSFEHNPASINLDYLMDDDTYLKPTTSLTQSLKNMKIGALRFPGGEKADNYLWSVAPYTSVNPHFATQGNCNWPNNDSRFSSDKITPKTTTMDFDEFMAVCAATGSRPLIVVSADAHYNDFCTNPPTLNSLITNAVEWVKYANITKKYNVKYWMIGNESWNSAAYDSPSTALQYANDFKQFAEAMKAVDSTIIIVANSKEGTWATTLLSTVTDDKLLNAIAISNYPTYGWTTGYEKYRTSAPSFTGAPNSVISSIGTRNIKVIISEYNCIDWSTGGWASTNDVGHALVNFQMFGDQIKIPQVEDAYLWNTRWVDNESSPQHLNDAIDKNGNLNATGKALALWGNYFSDKFITSTNSGYIRSFAMLDNTGKTLTIFLINKDINAATVNIAVSNFPAISLAGLTIEQAKLSGTGIADKAPSITYPTTGVTISGTTVSLSMSATSVLVIKIKAPENTPSIVVNPTSLAFGNVTTGTTSSEKTYTLTGSDLTANVTFTAPTGYEVSKTTGSGFAASVSVTPASGSLNQVIYVRFKPTAVQAYNGNVTHTTTGATAVSVALAGSGITTVITKYNLTVNSGTGSNQYAEGSKVSITANSALSGKLFDKWTGDVTYLKNTSDSINEITMPAKNISITATYKDKPIAMKQSYNEIEVYPNPATDLVYVSFSEKTEGIISIINTTGIVMMKENITSNEITLNVSGWAKGMYVIKITSSENVCERMILVH